jgi:hypothetical protein
MSLTNGCNGPRYALPLNRSVKGVGALFSCGHYLSVIAKDWVFSCAL